VAASAPPHRGEVVIFTSPEDGSRLVKRVAAVAGDRVAVRGGRLFVNGTPLADATHPDLEHWGSRTVHLNLLFGGGPDLAETEIPPGQLLVLGDARGNSRDGRFFGLVPERAVYARALRVFYRSGEGFVWRPL